MYLDRKIDLKIEKWIKNKDKKPLVVIGTRKCGKTTSVQEICNRMYKRVYYINFMREKDKPDFINFLKYPNYEFLLNYLQDMYGELKLDQDAVIIVDEIQEVNHFYTQLKFIGESKGFKNVICLGSYLSMNVFINKITVPVGQIDMLNMYTLGFDEFLMNVSPSTYKTYLEAFNKRSISEAEHLLFTNYFKSYLVVGGFPRAVEAFINSNHDYIEAKRINKDIHRLYQRDLGKYLTTPEQIKAIEVYKNAFLFMGKENNTFTLSTIRTSARYRDYEYAIMLLVESHICYKVDNCKNLSFPLVPFDSSAKYKIYPCDVGLVSGYYNLDIYNIETEGFKFIKGNLYEGYIMSELKRN